VLIIGVRLETKTNSEDDRGEVEDSKVWGCKVDDSGVWGYELEDLECWETKFDTKGELTGMEEKPGGTLGAVEEWEEECWNDCGVWLTNGGVRFGLRLK